MQNGQVQIRAGCQSLPLLSGVSTAVKCGGRGRGGKVGGWVVDCWDDEAKQFSGQVHLPGDEDGDRRHTGSHGLHGVSAGPSSSCHQRQITSWRGVCVCVCMGWQLMFLCWRHLTRSFQWPARLRSQECTSITEVHPLPDAPTLCPSVWGCLRGR